MNGTLCVVRGDDLDTFGYLLLFEWGAERLLVAARGLWPVGSHTIPCRLLDQQFWPRSANRCASTLQFLNLSDVSFDGRVFVADPKGSAFARFRVEREGVGPEAVWALAR